MDFIAKGDIAWPRLVSTPRGRLLSHMFGARWAGATGSPLRLRALESCMRTIVTLVAGVGVAVAATFAVLRPADAG